MGKTTSAVKESNSGTRLRVIRKQNSGSARPNEQQQFSQATIDNSPRMIGIATQISPYQAATSWAVPAHPSPIASQAAMLEEVRFAPEVPAPMQQELQSAPMQQEKKASGVTKRIRKAKSEAGNTAASTVKKEPKIKKIKEPKADKPPKTAEEEAEEKRQNAEKARLFKAEKTALVAAINEEFIQNHANIEKNQLPLLAVPNSLSQLNSCFYFEYMPQTATVVEVGETMDLVHSELTAISMLLKLLKTDDKKPAVISPEIQTAFVEDKVTGQPLADPTQEIHISANTKGANDQLKDIIGRNSIDERAFTLGEFYKKELKAESVKLRVTAIVNNIDTYKAKDAEALKVKFEKRAGNSTFSENVLRLVAAIQNKKSADRNVAKVARNSSKKYADYTLCVPENEEGIHAESAILSNLLGNLGSLAPKRIKQVAGTKVACLACMAFFKEKGNADLLGKITGYAWDSTSCMHQLEIAEGEDLLRRSRTYLEKIIEYFEDDFKGYKRYTGAFGNKKREHLAEAAEIDITDSEDEEARKVVLGTHEEKLKKIHEALYGRGKEQKP